MTTEMQESSEAEGHKTSSSQMYLVSDLRTRTNICCMRRQRSFLFQQLPGKRMTSQYGPSFDRHAKLGNVNCYPQLHPKLLGESVAVANKNSASMLTL